MYMGMLQRGSSVEISLRCAPGNAGSALLALSYAKTGFSDAAAEAVPPDATGKVTLRVDGTGWLRVWVDMNRNSDKGQMSVMANGTPVDSEHITGDTTWTYTVA